MVFEEFESSLGALFKFLLMGAIAYDQKLASTFLGRACEMVGMVGQGRPACASQEDRYGGNDTQGSLDNARQAQLGLCGRLRRAA